MFGKKSFLIVIIAVLVVVAGIGLWYWQKRGGSGFLSQLSGPTAKELSPAEVKKSLGTQILEQTQNPLKGKLPPTNPFEKTETNPLKDIYQNPF